MQRMCNAHIEAIAYGLSFIPLKTRHQKIHYMVYFTDANKPAQPRRNFGGQRARNVKLAFLAKSRQTEKHELR